VLWKVGLLYGPNYFCHIYLWHTVDVMDSVVMLVHFVAVGAAVCLIAGVLLPHYSWVSVTRQRRLS
jgi:hypothetical protein